jgi:CheY-like chemotaxis protein
VSKAPAAAHEGTGIGLALVQELTRLHGGAVRVESQIGYGSTFIVSIPLGTAHLPPDRVRTESALASTLQGSQPYIEDRWLRDSTEDQALEDARADILVHPAEPRKCGDQTAIILLADDNADMRDYVARLLAPFYEVQVAADGMDALSAIKNRRPDLLLSDVMMPRLDGFGLVREIRSDPALADLPIILVSARAGEDESIQGLEAGADDYLVKPFGSRELLARVSSSLKKNGQHQKGIRAAY